MHSLGPLCLFFSLQQPRSISCLDFCCPTKHALPISFAAWKQRSWAAICEFQSVWPLWTFSRAAFPRQVLCPANQPSPSVLLGFPLEVMVKGQSFLLTKAWAWRLLCVRRACIACCFLRQSPLSSCWPQTHYVVKDDTEPLICLSPYLSPYSGIISIYHCN